MAMSRTLRFSLLFALLCTAAASCISPPDYSDTPRIKFKKLEAVRITSPTGIFDSDTITVSFEDGNGDLGLSSEDTMEPYNEVIDPLTKRNTNLNYFNYYIQPQVKRPGDQQFVDFVNAPPLGFVGEYNSRYPRLGPDSDKEAPLKGDLRFNIKLFLGSPFNTGDQVRFKVSIKDRALNQSNEIITDSYTVQ
jgi:hypothetical protein